MYVWSWIINNIPREKKNCAKLKFYDTQIWLLTEINVPIGLYILNFTISIL